MRHFIATTVAVLAVALPAACAAPTNFELHAYEPVASPNATVTAGAARFTVLSEQLIRAEYSVDGGKTFEDRPTLFAVQRAPVNGVLPKFSTKPLSNGGVEISTSHVVLTYSGGAFSKESLRASIDGGKFTWDYSQQSSADAGNLRGTYRTLDGTKNVTLNCNTNGKEGDHCAWGVVSRSGWAVVNDTASPCLDADLDWWADASGKMNRNADAEDLYLFAHGHDYAAALEDLSRVG